MYFFLILGIVIFSIHQPRRSIFDLFDTILLLSHGYTVYLGSPKDLTSYFVSKGFPYQPSENPADFALDVLVNTARNNQTENLCAMYRDSCALQLSSDLSSAIAEDSNVIIEQPIKRVQSIKSEYFYVAQRTLRTALRNSNLLICQLGVAVILAVLTGLLFYRLPQTVGSGVKNRIGGIFFVVVSQIFSTATALEPFIKERALFIHVSVFIFK